MSALEDIKARSAGHSLAPWAVMNVNDPGEGVNFIEVYSETDGLEMVCRMPNPADFSTREYLEADAALIAVAPKLLAALEAVEALHARHFGKWADPNGIPWIGDHCTECRDEWPCDTAEAITEALK